MLFPPKSIPQQRVRATLRSIDPIGSVSRGLEVLLTPRRPDSVPSPLSLWHIDGNHEFVRQVFVYFIIFNNVKNFKFNKSTNKKTNHCSAVHHGDNTSLKTKSLTDFQY